MIFIKHIRPLTLLLLIAVSVLLFPGCRLNPHSESDDVHVRLINAVPDAGALNVSVDGQRVWKQAAFRSSTGYQGIAAGTYSIQVSSESYGAMLTNRPITFQKDHAYTVLAWGLTRNAGTPAQVQVLADDPPMTGEKAGLRLINVAPGAGPVDLVVNNIVGLEAIKYGRRSGVLLLDSGDYDLKIAPANTPDTLAGPVRLHLDSGRTYTLVVMGQPSDNTLSLEAYSDAR